MKFKLSVLLFSAAPFILSACSTVSSKAVELNKLQQHRWDLISINGEAVNRDLNSDLEIDTQLKVNGKAGCNRFFGEASISGTKVAAPNLATTMMACLNEAQEIEQAVLATLTQGAKVSINNSELTLKGKEFTLTYQVAK